MISQVEECRTSAGLLTPCFNPIAIANIVGLVEDSRSLFNLSIL